MNAMNSRLGILIIAVNNTRSQESPYNRRSGVNRKIDAVNNLWIRDIRKRLSTDLLACGNFVKLGILMEIDDDDILASGEDANHAHLLRNVESTN